MLRIVLSLHAAGALAADGGAAASRLFPALRLLFGKLCALELQEPRLAADAATALLNAASELAALRSALELDTVRCATSHPAAAAAAGARIPSAHALLPVSFALFSSHSSLCRSC